MDGGGPKDGKEPQQDDIWGKKRDEIKEKLGERGTDL